MRKQLRDRERQLFKESMDLKRLDLSKTSFDQSEQIRIKQNDSWHRHLFFKGYLAQLEKQDQNKES